MYRYTRRHKRVDLKISVGVRKEKAVSNKDKITCQLSIINYGQVDKNSFCFLLINELTWWWFESHFDIFIFLFGFALYMY